MNKPFDQILLYRILKLDRQKPVYLYPKNDVSEKLYENLCEKGVVVKYFIPEEIQEVVIVVICEDRFKVKALNELAALPWESRRIQVITAGRKHLDTVQIKVKEIEKKFGLESHAVGYQYTKAHLLESIEHIVHQGISGWVVELGTLRGGTLALIEKLFEQLEYRNHVQIAGFDTWDGSLPHHTFLDIFDMEEWVSTQGDYNIAKAIVSETVLLKRGDIAATFPAWADTITEPIALAFVDTDNFTATATSLPILWDKLATGGAVIFDHYFTYEDFFDTVGEHVAVSNFFQGRKDYYHLTGTGVFMKV